MVSHVDCSLVLTRGEARAATSLRSLPDRPRSHGCFTRATCNGTRGDRTRLSTRSASAEIGGFRAGFPGEHRGPRRTSGGDEGTSFSRGASGGALTSAASGVSGGGLTSALPSPPAGFVLDDNGEVVAMAPEAKRIVTLWDEAAGRSLDCVIRRMCVATSGLQFFLLYPLDVPVIIFHVSDSREGGDGRLLELDDSELVSVFPDASYALARRNFHLVLSGFVLTVRGAVCFSQDDVSSIDAASGFGIGSDLTEGVEIASFERGGREYVVYTPFDPLLFPAYRDPATGKVVLAEDEELLGDPKAVAAMEEEEEYQRMVNEEEEMAEILAGEAAALGGA